MIGREVLSYIYRRRSGRNALALKQQVVIALVDSRTLADCETVRTPPLMSQRTIRTRDEGGWSGVGGT